MAKNPTRRDMIGLAAASVGLAAAGAAKAQDTMSLSIGGAEFSMENPQERALAINRDLQDPTNFQNFVQDPVTWGAQNGVTVSPEIAGQIQGQLQGVQSLDQAQDLIGNQCLTCATVVAVAEGALAVTSSKVAVAF